MSTAPQDAPAPQGGKGIDGPVVPVPQPPETPCELREWREYWGQPRSAQLGPATTGDTMNETTTGPWTDEDVEVATDQVAGFPVDGYTPIGHEDAHDIVTAVLDVLAPRVAELQRAAKVEALREAAWALRGLAGAYTGPRIAEEIERQADEIERGA